MLRALKDKFCMILDRFSVKNGHFYNKSHPQIQIAISPILSASSKNDVHLRWATTQGVWSSTHDTLFVYVLHRWQVAMRSCPAEKRNIGNLVAISYIHLATC